MMNKTQGGRLRNVILDFGEELEEYCVEKDLLIAESLAYQEMYEKFLECQSSIILIRFVYTC